MHISSPQQHVDALILYLTHTNTHIYIVKKLPVCPENQIIVTSVHVPVFIAVQFTQQYVSSVTFYEHHRHISSVRCWILKFVEVNSSAETEVEALLVLFAYDYLIPGYCPCGADSFDRKCF